MVVVVKCKSVMGDGNLPDESWFPFTARICGHEHRAAHSRIMESGRSPQEMRTSADSSGKVCGRESSSAMTISRMDESFSW
jgi:hypothetical protein